MQPVFIGEYDMFMSFCSSSNQVNSWCHIGARTPFRVLHLYRS